MLTAAGFPELVCEDAAAYEELIVSLAESPERLAALKDRIARTAPTSPLFNTAQYARHLDAAYQTMHARSQAGATAKGFSVADLDSSPQP